MRLGIEGAGALAHAVRAAAEQRAWSVTSPAGGAPDAVVIARPPTSSEPAWSVPTVGAVVRQVDAERSTADVPAAGWWGGLGALLADVALREAEAPAELHVAYGLLGGATALRRASPALREDLARAAMEPAVARIGSRVVDEPLGEGRRLAWFPAPVGPAHAVAVGGLEQTAPLEVPTVRTWLAAGSLAAEALQALGRRDPDRGLGRWLVERARASGAEPGATEDLRWAVVVEVRDHDDEIVRAWANGTDPLACAGASLVSAAGRVTALPDAEGRRRSLLDLGPATGFLDELADARVLRWSVGRPTPARR